ncbi:MAG: 1-phosphofructokinase [Ktedonobacteraceae bacterium]
MRVATVTLNPAIDQTVWIDGFQTNMVNRARLMQIEASGKGVNVAAFLADSGVATTGTGYLGQDNADLFEQFFASKHIEDCFIRIPGRTRINIKIVDEVNQQSTDLNLPGLIPPEEAQETLFKTLEHLVTTCDWFVLSSSLPPSTSKTTYAAIITFLKHHGKRVVLDTSGDALREGVLVGPTIVKPNIDELQYLAGYPLKSETDVHQSARHLLNKGIQLVVVSMGERGAIFVDQDTALLAVPPTMSVKRSAGAGDAMVAGLLAGQRQGLNLSDCARLATAFSMGAITRIGPHLPIRETLQMYARSVSVRAITRK